MDASTEPIIAVIGHPIAGNPSQFAVERALQSMDFDWRVLSFDVLPEDVASALEGFAVTGIAGPDGGSEAKPVGTVFIALAGNNDCQVEQFSFSGDRKRIQILSAHSGLNMIRLYLETDSLTA